ncbi:MAG: O-antigen ligase family protein, partial [Planctomycetaceae bacterium]|nr:O-antigen ligase family protein [Planctomycetaceae bacterium]
MHRSQTTTINPALPALPSGLLWLPLLCGWLLMFATISPPDRGAAVIGSFDVFGVAKIAVRLLVIAMLGIGWFCLWQRRGRFDAVSRFLPFLAFAAWAVLSTGWSPLKTVSLGQSMSLVSLLMLSISYGLFCRDMDDISRVLKHITCGLVLLNCLILFCYFFVPQLHALQRGEVAALLHPTNAAATAALGMVLLVGCQLVWKWRWATYLLLPGVCASAGVLLLAMNRWSPIVTALVLVLLFARFAGRTMLLGSVLFASTVGALYLVADPGMTVIDKATAATVATASRGQSIRQLSAFSGREKLWDKMWDSHEESPWVGHGYFVTSADGEVKVWDSTSNITAHNFLLQILVTTGFVGMALFLFGVFRPVVGIWFDLVRMRGNTSFAAFCALLACWYVGWGAINSSIAGPLQPESVVFFTVFGLAVGLAVTHRLAVSEQQAVSDQ